MGLNWLITGGCGFIGVNLVERLRQDNKNHIRILDNLSIGSREDLETVSAFDELLPGNVAEKGWGNEQTGFDRVQLIIGDILDEKVTMQAAAGADVIVHLAANTGVGPSVDNPRLDCITNVIGVLNMLEAARHNGVKRFVFASSGAPVGEVEPPIHEELAPHPVSPYGASKLAGEGYCSAYHRTFGVETIALRFGNVYGPRSNHKSSIIAKFIRQAINGEALEIYGDGKQTRDFIYIGDLVEAVALAATKHGIGGEIFQIATNSETTVHELLEILLPILKDSGVEDIKVKYAEPRVGDVRRNFSEIQKAKMMLGWIAKTNLKDGLKWTVKMYPA